MRRMPAGGEVVKSRFFCDFCGLEVSADEIRCRRCGRIFESTFCARCGNSGPASSFKNGCPKCGFLSPSKKRGKAGWMPKAVAILAVLAAALILLHVVSNW